MLSERLEGIGTEPDAIRRWQRLIRECLSTDLPEELHWEIYQQNFAHWPTASGPPPVWLPSEEESCQANVTGLLKSAGISRWDELAPWAQTHPTEYWKQLIELLSIRFRRPPKSVIDLADSPQRSRWLVGARMNIVDSCLQHESASIVGVDESGQCQTMNRDQLRSAVLQFAGALRASGIGPGDAVALIMSLSVEATVAYLGTIAAGAMAVGIAESFANAEIERRVRLGNAKLIFVQHALLRQGKWLPVYERLKSASLPPMIILRRGTHGDSGQATPPTTLRSEDCLWQDFMQRGTPFAEPLECSPEDGTTVLFSSGTTGDPKAIPWSHITPIQCVVDGFLYQDVRSSDVITWPTGMGWMMGPWLLFVGLIRGAKVVLFDGHGATSAFVRCIEKQRVTVLGVIPSLVAAWRRSKIWNDADWSRVRLFTTTGECSHPRDMLALMARAGYRPVMEYCGGTELAGGYLGCSIVRPAALSYFNQIAPSVELVLRNDTAEASQRGEAFLRGVSIGFSTRLLNGDHHRVYFAETPRDEQGQATRRHGDALELLANGYVRVLGRADDAMNLGGIKISAVELERVCNEHAQVIESAAVAVSDPDGGPGQLVIFVVSRITGLDPVTLRAELQQLLRERLSPQFQIREVRIVEALPRTASNKVMRRLLR